MPFTPANRLIVDSIDVYTAYGIFIQDGGLTGLVSMPSFKKVEMNDWHEEDGIDVDLSDLKFAGRQFTISFCSTRRILGATAQKFVDFLSQKVYRVFYFPDLGMTWTLRYVSSSSFKTNAYYDSFTLTFADDNPVVNATAPASSVSVPCDYAIDGNPLSYFGCIDVKGTLDSFHRLAGLKNNLSRNVDTEAGLIYDADTNGTPKQKFSDVTLQLHIKTDGVYNFWHNYHALFYALTKENNDGQALRTVSDSCMVAQCYYKGSRVSKFKLLDNGIVWCDFSVTLCVISVEERAQDWQYLEAENGSAVGTETTYPEFVIIEPMVVNTDGQTSGSNNTDRGVKISELPEVQKSDMAGMVTIGVDKNGKSVKVPFNKISSGGGFYNLDNEHPLDDGEKYNIESAVAVVSSDEDISDEQKNGMIITFYDGGEWKTYRYKNVYDPNEAEAAEKFADVGNWEEFQSGGGGEETARIVLRRLSGDVITKVGSTVTVSFHYDHVTGSGDDQHSTGNSATARLIISRAGYQETINMILAPGNYTQDITRYLGVGVSTVRLQVSVNNGGSIQTAALTWLINEVKLNLVSGDLTGATFVEQGHNIEFHYTLESGSSDTKAIICYVDGVQFGQNTVATSVSNGSFSIPTALMSHGGHTIQLRAQQTTGRVDENDDEIFIYSNLIYAVVGVYTPSATTPLLTMKIDMNDGSTIFGENDTLVVHVNQYDTLYFTYGARSKDSNTTEVTIEEDDVVVLAADNAREEASFSSRMFTSGTKSYTINAGAYAQIAFSVIADYVDLGITVPSDRKLFLDSVEHGHSNSDSNKDTWTNTEGGVTTTTHMSNFTWNGDGWVNGALRLKGAARATVNYKPLQETQSGGTVVGFKYRCTDVAEGSEGIKVISCLDSNGTGIYITPTEIVMQQYNNVRATMKTAAGNVYDVAFVVWPASVSSTTDKINERFIYIYIDGIISGGYRLEVNTSLFQITSVPISLGNSGVTTDIYRVWAFNRALNDGEMLNTYILDQDDNMEYLLQKREDNDILDPNSSDTVTPDSLPNGTRIMIITGRATPDGGTPMASVLAAATVNDKKKYFPCTEISTYIKGATDHSRNFIARNNGSDIVEGQDMSLKLRLQGTSSLAYPVKNYRIYTKKSTMYVGNSPDMPFGDTGTLVENGLFSIHSESAPVAVWCLKADYAESSSSHNTGMACMVNDTLDSVNVPTPVQRDVDTEKYPYEVRTTVDGEPCILFYRETLSDTPLFLGKFNFNNDKSTEAVFGFTSIPGYHDRQDSPVSDIDNTVTHFTAQQYHLLHSHDTGYKKVGALTECWEFKNNEFPMGSFLDDDFISSTDGVRNWTGTFEARYPDNDGLNDDFESGAIVPHYLSTLVKWVKSTHVTSSDTEQQASAKLQKFQEELHYYFDVEHLCCYFAFTQIMACLDQMVKNMMMAFWYDRNAEDGDSRPAIEGGSTGMGRVRAYMIFYDNDTILGVINDGRLLAPYDVTRDTVFSEGGYFFAGHDSVLWNNLVSRFTDEIRAAYVKVRGYLSNDKIFEYFDTRQSAKFCERIYNLDALNKYVAPVGNLGEGRTALMQGSRKTHRHFFVEKRLEIYDNYFATGGFDYADNKVGFKGINSLSELGVESSDISLKLAKDGNVKVTIDGTAGDSFSGIYACTANTLVTLKKTYDSAIGSQHWLYGTKMMTYLDFSLWNIVGEGWEIGNTKFPRLEEFVFGRSGSVFTKVGFNKTLNIGSSMPYLRKLIVQNCVSLPSVNISECSIIEEVDLTGSTKATDVAMQNGVPLKRYVLPTNGLSSSAAASATPFNLRLVGLPVLDEYDSGTGNGLILGDKSRIGSLTFKDCPNIDVMSLLGSILNTANNSLSAIDITLPNALSGAASVLTAIIAKWNSQYNTESNLKMAGTFTVIGQVTSEECAIIGYDKTNAGVAQPNSKIYGLSVIIQRSQIGTYTLQTTEPLDRGYNPAVCIRMANAGYGTWVDASDHTKGWYLTREQAEAITSLPSFQNVTSVTDSNAIVLASGGDTSTTYNFTSFDELEDFSSLQSIPNSCFASCTLLASIKFPSSITTVGQEAFDSCSSLAISVNLPNLTTLGSSAFWYSGIVEIASLGEITNIPTGAFDGTASLVRAVIPEGVTTIRGFYQSGVVTVELPSTTTTIEANAFSGCSQLKNISLPSSITTIGNNAFLSCSRMTIVVNLPNLTSLGQGAFDTSGISQVLSLGSITSIPNDVFWLCPLTSIVIPATVTSIGSTAFYNNSNMTSLTSLNTTPPTYSGDNNLPALVAIYVPAASVNAYKGAWTNRAANIRAIE